MTVPASGAPLEKELHGRELAVATYGERAVGIVERGYRRMESALVHMKERGLVSRGVKLSEAVRNNPDDFPALMSPSEINWLQEVSAQYLMQPFLTAVWFILENVCHEHRLMPAITIDRDNGEAVVRLIG